MLATLILALTLSNTPTGADSVALLIRQHVQRYPAMRVQDVYKLLFQGEFGVGHLLGDEHHVQMYLEDELAHLEPAAQGEELVESVSPDGGMVRVNLRPFMQRGLSPDSLVRAMMISAAGTAQDTARFVARWDVFLDLTGRGMFPFGKSELQEWSARVRERPLPVVHHSAEYTESYRPAYRVCRREVFERLFGRAAGGRP